MKLKLDENGHVVVQDGKPVYVHDDGKEYPFDAAATVSRISALNAEAKGHREAKEAAESRLKVFEGIEDPAAARKAMELVKNLDSKKLIDAGEVDKVRAEAIKAVEEKYKPYVDKTTKLEQELYGERIGGAFARSKVIADKFSIPADLVQARFGNAFSLEEGKIVARDSAGNKLYSRANPGELATFDEAIELLVDAYPHKDHILKASGASGSGARGGGAVSGRAISRAEFDKMSPAEQAKTAQAAGKGEVTITD